MSSSINPKPPTNQNPNIHTQNNPSNLTLNDLNDRVSTIKKSIQTMLELMRKSKQSDKVEKDDSSVAETIILDNPINNPINNQINNNDNQQILIILMISLIIPMIHLNIITINHNHNNNHHHF